MCRSLLRASPISLHSHSNLAMQMVMKMMTMTTATTILQVRKTGLEKLGLPKILRLYRAEPPPELMTVRKAFVTPSLPNPWSLLIQLIAS